MRNNTPTVYRTQTAVYAFIKHLLISQDSINSNIGFQCNFYIKWQERERKKSENMELRKYDCINMFIWAQSDRLEWNRFKHNCYILVIKLNKFKIGSDLICLLVLCYRLRWKQIWYVPN